MKNNCWNCLKKHECWDDKYIDPNELDVACKNWEDDRGF